MKLGPVSAVVLTVAVCFLFLSGRVIPFTADAAAQESTKLAVSVDPTGGVRAEAILLFPAGPEILQAILTDYEKWPQLFDVRMRLVDLQMHDGIAVTDLRIAHALLPGERRLLCESRVVPGGGLITDLKGGDFKRYHRVWRLSPMEGGTQTEAEFTLEVEIDTIVPDWMIAMAVRRELDAHFRIVREKAIERTRGK